MGIEKEHRTKVISLTLDLRDALDSLEELCRTYLSNLNTSSEFVTCITPNGPMKEWEAAKRVLRRNNRLT